MTSAAHCLEHQEKKAAARAYLRGGLAIGEGRMDINAIIAHKSHAAHAFCVLLTVS